MSDVSREREIDEAVRVALKKEGIKAETLMQYRWPKDVMDHWYSLFWAIRDIWREAHP